MNWAYHLPTALTIIWNRVNQGTGLSSLTLAFEIKQALNVPRDSESTHNILHHLLIQPNLTLIKWRNKPVKNM